MTKKFGILAFPAKHSLSPVVQNAAFNEAGIDADFRVFEISDAKFSEFIEYVKHEPVYGLSVSAPYKEQIMDSLSVMSDEVKEIGACNTVLNKGGLLYGFNTDYLGSNRALEDVCGDLKGLRVMVIGAGGASRAVIYGLVKAGAKVCVVNRHKEKAEKLAKEFGKNIEYGGLDEKENFDGYGVLVQASSIWLSGNFDSSDIEAFCPESFVQKFEVVMDIIYQPIKTPLIKIAEKLGKKTVTGEKMFLYQAFEQFKIWTDEKAPEEIMRDVLYKNLVMS